MLAKLGRAPLACMWAALEYGVFLEEDFDEAEVKKEKTEVRKQETAEVSSSLVSDIEFPCGSRR